MARDDDARDVAVFAHGVASGDPLPHRVVLWTRVSVDDGEGRPDVPVIWQVSRDPELADVVASGQVMACAGHDYTVHVEAGGLEPATTYHYRFLVGDASSPLGHTRTAPAGPVERARLGVVSCSSWRHGLFNAYARLAEHDLDLVVHLGDYLYADAGGRGRSVRPPHLARELVTLADYRAAHARQKGDPDLQRLHARFPMMAVWDDHEVAGNAWVGGAERHHPAWAGPWEQRRANAVRAYFEWMPVRPPDPSDPERIHRALALGDLAEVILLDTRLYGRQRPFKGGTRPVLRLDHPHRSMLGPAQRRWLLERLQSSPCRWHLVATAVVMSPLRAFHGLGLNADQWDGYPAERAGLWRFLHHRGIDDVVVLSGDLHGSFAGELVVDDDEAGPPVPVGVELVAPAVSSPSFAFNVRVPRGLPARLLARWVRRQNPHLRFVDAEGRGYLVLDVTPERVRADWWHVDTVARHDPGQRLVASWEVHHAVPGLTKSSDAGPSPSRRPGHPHL